MTVPPSQATPTQAPPARSSNPPSPAAPSDTDSRDIPHSPEPSPSSLASASLSKYYNASHLRSDAWDELKVSSGRLSAASERGAGLQEWLETVSAALEVLRPIEMYWAFPGKHHLEDLQRLLDRGHYSALAVQTAGLVRLLVSGAYRKRDLTDRQRMNREDGEERLLDREGGDDGSAPEERSYFEVLLVDDVSPREEAALRSGLLALRDEQDDFVYDLVAVPSFEDALIAVLFNYNIQACLLRDTMPYRSVHHLEVLQKYIGTLDPEEMASIAEGEEGLGFALGRLIKHVRPELDLFLVTDSPVEDIAGQSHGVFRRIFYRQEDYQELHGSLLRSIGKRYEAPFFNALMTYVKKPTGVFHALPISRGKSITKSHWIQDIGRFYGPNIFRAETSATTGGLDSLLQPKGPLKKAQAAAARAFGARRTFFVTNGTSTGNKIVVQALVRPDDIVLVDRDCHKSHHYGMMLAGAHVVYLDSYPLSEYSMYGAVPASAIKQALLELKAAGKLDRVRMVLLTNCTFDGLTYYPEKLMHELLAIKPDLIFLWDEAWFAFAYFNPTLRRRTGIEGASRLLDRYRSDAYRAKYDAWRRALGERELEDEDFLAGRVLPDPDLVRVRVYATQSTHKTLTAMRQGSMIQVFDQGFEEQVSGAFHEAYMTHTSTSPSYQILASLDIGRRQVELEGYELVQKSIELAMVLRSKLQLHPLLRRYFRVLGPKELIPDEYRPSNIRFYYDPDEGWSRMEQAWAGDEFALDPTRITLDVGRTGMDGSAFRHLLIEDFDIQINKTSRNTVLFMVHIGTTRGAVAHLIEVLTTIAENLEEEAEEHSSTERRLQERRVRSLTEELPPLPDFSRFHRRFLSDGGKTPEGDLRRAFFLAYDETANEYLRLDGEIEAALDLGREVVSSSFVIPYPPGFPILVPGQVISREILGFLKALDITEIHGYEPDYGLKVFTEAALAETAVTGGVSK